MTFPLLDVIIKDLQEQLQETRTILKEESIKVAEQAAASCDSTVVDSNAVVPVGMVPDNGSLFMSFALNSLVFIVLGILVFLVVLYIQRNIRQ